MTRLRSATRFTLLYGAVFLVSGTGLLALAFLFSGGLSDVSPAPTGVTDAQRIRALEDQLAQVGADRTRQMLVGFLLALLVMVACSAVVGRVMARRAIQPLRTITAATRRISADSLDRRLAVDGPADEVKELADTIDALLARLEASFTAQRRFVANASHELRTPLATMRASLDVAANKPEPPPQIVALADRVRTQLDRTDRLLDGLLTLARAQHGVPGDQSAEVDVASAVRAALAERAGTIAAKRLDVTADLSPGIGTVGDSALLTQMVENVVDNAVTHNDEGGWIRVAADRDGGAVRLDVRTGGRVLDQRDVDRLAQPFQRLGADRVRSDSGTGLGLSIVAAIVAAHGGRLELRADPEGGLRVAIALPAAP